MKWDQTSNLMKRNGFFYVDHPLLLYLHATITTKMNNHDITENELSVYLYSTLTASLLALCDTEIDNDILWTMPAYNLLANNCHHQQTRHSLISHTPIIYFSHNLLIAMQQNHEIHEKQQEMTIITQNALGNHNIHHIALDSPLDPKQ